MKNRRHQGKHTRPYACKEACCNVKPFGDKAGLIRHSREVHGAQAEGGAAPDFRCSVAGCKRGRKGFSRQWNLDQHYRRMHGRSNNEGKNNKATLIGTAEAETKCLSSMELGQSANGTPQAQATSDEITDNASDQANIASGQQSPHQQNSALVKVVQAELDTVRAQKLEASRRFDGKISTLEAALVVLRQSP